MYIQYLGEIVPPSRHNAVGVCNQVTFLILYYPMNSTAVKLGRFLSWPKQMPKENERKKWHWICSAKKSLAKYNGISTYM